MLNHCFLKCKKGYSETQEEEIIASCKIKSNFSSDYGRYSNRE